MPTYEYRCNSCMANIVLQRDVKQRNDKVVCVCGQESDRIYNTPGIQFKGTGFYSTGG